MDLLHLGKKITHMKSIEVFYFYKWVTNNKEFSEKLK